jgi:protein O-mannosyl-transferase
VNPPARAPDPSRWLIAATLLVLTLAAYEGVRHCGFLGHDDDLLVSQNPVVRQGLTLHGVRWAFVADLLYDSRLANYWTPLAVLSHMLDVSLFGMSPVGHHLMNLLFHALNVVLAFFVFEGLTGARWRSVWVAAILAVHPVHVESVAWVSERKDVLSATFWLLAMAAYIAYARRPSGGRMAAVASALALGLMAKPMLITLPFALLLLDVWPLGRGPLRLRLILEKWPLFLLAVASVGATFLSNLNGRGFDELPLSSRITNALAAYVSYLRAAFWPWPLAVAYPHVGGSLPAGRLVGCVAALATISVVAVGCRARRPYLLLGWCWFLGTLVPAMGLVVQSGSQGWADRFMYVPLMGLSLAISWLAGDWAKTRRRATVAGSVAVVVVLCLAALTRHQVRYWTDDLTLFRHAVAVSPSSEVAHVGLAAALGQQGNLDGAEAEYREALRQKPDFMWARMSLSTLLQTRGQTAQAAAVLEEGLRAAPDKYSFERGLLAARQGRPGEAMELYARALAQNPAHHAALYNWGNLLAAEGRMPEAVEKYRAAARLDRDDGAIANNLALALLFSGHAPEAEARLRAAIELDPESAPLRTSLGLTLAASGRRAEALAQLQEALRLNPQSSDARAALEAELRRP